MKQSDKYENIREIVDAICDEEVTPEQLQELETQLTGNPEAKAFYLNYLGMHVQLSGTAREHMEFAYRRTTEEFIVRPKTHALDTEVPASEIIEHEPKSSQIAWLNVKTLSLLLLGMGLVLVLIFWRMAQNNINEFSADIISGQFSIVNLGRLDENRLYTGEYQTNQDATLKLSTGETLQLKAHSQIKLLNQNEIELKQGTITLEQSAPRKLVVHAPTFSVYANNAPLSVDLTTAKPIVKSDNEFVLIPHRWRPKHYWAFESQTDRALDSAGHADGIPSDKATRTNGLLGKGAFYFENHHRSRIDVGSGGGIAPATGSFSVTDGVTIEALIQSDYAGDPGDVDEIFRKDQTDRDLRILLAIQYDPVIKPYLRPEGELKESLSFGLFVVGEGYHELKLPLDGTDGRPSLKDMTDGSTHHIVATYDVSSGLKAIYVNGIMLAHYQYPPGSKVLSGGSGTTNIGNSPNWGVNLKHNKPRENKMFFNEAFNGVIDEVAFYDFALPPWMVKTHFQNTQNNQNYYGLHPSSAALPQQIGLTLPANQTIEISPLSGLPAQIVH